MSAQQFLATMTSKITTRDCMHRTSNNHNHNTATTATANNKHTSICRRRPLSLNGIIMMLMVCGGGGWLQLPPAIEAATLSMPISARELGMLRVLNILAKSENSNNNNNNDNNDNDNAAMSVADYSDSISDIDSDEFSTGGSSRDDDSGLRALELSDAERRLHTDVYALRSMQRMRRHRKRHSQYLLEQPEHADNLEWSNPCGGVFDADAAAAEERPSRRQYLSLVRDTSYLEYSTLTEGPHNITVSDIKEWKMHRNHYKFLPALNSSKIGLKRWYRKMQVYVAAFAYLGRAQRRWEDSKQLPTSATRLELNELLISARRILCELETAINGSYSRPASQEKLAAFTRAEMNEKLNAFLTKLQQSRTDAPIEPYTQDLKFAKYRYVKMLERMFSMLETYVKAHSDQQAQLSDASDAGGGSSSTSIEDNVSLSLRELVMRNNSKQPQPQQPQQPNGKKQRGQQQRRANQQARKQHAT